MKHFIFCWFLAAICISSLVRADIFQWEYINPADPALGKQQSATLCVDGADANAAPGAGLSGLNLTMAYLTGANLTNAGFSNAIITDADFTAAEVRGANFSRSLYGSVKSGISVSQLYSTASYQARDL